MTSSEPASVPNADGASPSLDSQIAEIRTTVEDALTQMREIAQNVVTKGEEGIDRLLADHGKARCVACNGTGAVERLDSGYRRWFGFTMWEGCKACGGDGADVRGKGYVDANVAQVVPEVHQRIGKGKGPVEGSDDQPERRTS
jgi:hypothetical protein